MLRERGKGQGVLENVRDDNYALQVITRLRLNGAGAPGHPSIAALKRELSPENHGLKKRHALSLSPFFLSIRSSPLIYRGFNCFLSYFSLFYKGSIVIIMY